MIEASQNKALAKPCVIGKYAEIQLAAAKPKVRDGNINGLESILRYIITLIGLKPDNLPDNFQKAVILDVIKQDFGSYSPDEFIIAFRLLVKGELDVDPNHYQNFNALYFGQVMKAYNQHRLEAIRRQRQEEISRPKEIDKTIEMQNKIGFIRDTLIFGWTNYLKTDVVTFGVTPWNVVYRNLVDEMKLFEIPAEEKFKIWDEAKRLVQQWHQKKLATTYDLGDKKRLKDEACEIAEQGIDKVLRNKVLDVSMEIAIRKMFATWKAEKTDVVQLIETHIAKLTP